MGEQIIIGLSGRNGSGKTELSKICSKYGYEVISFASPLKRMLSNILNISINKLNSLKTSNFEYKLDENGYKIIYNETNIPIEILKKETENVIFHNTRELMQIIGTNIIRKYNANWHVSKLKDIIINNPNINYVIDDVRFENEKKMIESLGGTTWFIIKPSFTNISNHISETALKWQCFDNIIINNGSLELLKFKWETFIKNGYKESLLIKQKLENKLNNDFNLIIKYINNNNLCLFDIYFLNKELFTYNCHIKENDLIEDISLENNILRYTKNDKCYVTSNPFEIEDIKMFIKKKNLK